VDCAADCTDVGHLSCLFSVSGERRLIAAERWERCDEGDFCTVLILHIGYIKLIGLADILHEIQDFHARGIQKYMLIFLYLKDL
jgi:hypothetical protein